MCGKRKKNSPKSIYIHYYYYYERLLRELDWGKCSIETEHTSFYMWFGRRFQVFRKKKGESWDYMFWKNEPGREGSFFVEKCPVYVYMCVYMCVCGQASSWKVCLYLSSFCYLLLLKIYVCENIEARVSVVFSGRSS